MAGGRGRISKTFRSFFELAIVAEECERQSFGDFYNCIWLYRQNCSVKLTERCRREAKRIENQRACEGRKTLLSYFEG